MSATCKRLVPVPFTDGKYVGECGSVVHGIAVGCPDHPVRACATAEAERAWRALHVQRRARVLDLLSDGALRAARSAEILAERDPRVWGDSARKSAEDAADLRLAREVLR